MIVRSILFALMASLCATTSHATNITVDPGVYNKTVKRTKAFLASEKGNLGAWVFQSKHNGWRDLKHKNKRRDNILFIPEKINALNDGDITLIVWYHGLGGFKESTFRRSWQQVKEIMSETDHVVALAIPEMPWSVNTSTPRGRQGRVWTRAGEGGGFVRESTRLLTNVTGFDGRINVIIVGHSAGGSAIASASAEGSICELMPSVITSVVWSDASYGSWLSRAHNGCLGKQARLENIDVSVVVRKWDTPHKKATQFFKRKGRKDIYHYMVLPRKKYTHTKIGNNILLILLPDLFPPGC